MPAPGFLDTGSLTFNSLLHRERVGTGRVLHLCGGDQQLQQLVLLGLCKAAVDRGEASVYLDSQSQSDGLCPLQPERIERAGLLALLNPGAPDDPDAPVRVLQAQTLNALDEQLRTALSLSPAPSVVVVNGLSCALENGFGGARIKGEKLASAGRSLYNLIQKQRLLCARMGTTVVLSHSPQKARGESPTMLERTVRGTLFAHCDFGLELGQAWQVKRGDDFFRVPVQAWRYNTRSGEEAVFEMGRNGQFKNP